MFYSSFIVGFEDVVSKIIRDSYKNISLTQVLNGGIIYRAGSSDHIDKIGFLNNSFFVFKYSKETNILTFIDQLHHISLKRGNYRRSFRIIVSDQNNLIGIDNGVLSNLEHKIEKETGYYVNRNKPDIEYWILKRSEGIILFMERINKHKSFDKQLNKGELRDDLCCFLNYLSEPSENDIYLDCFCGSGAIIKNRIKMHKFNMIFGIDIEHAYIQELKKISKKNNLIFKNIDFFTNKFENAFIDKIVTDPPWGLFDHMEDIDKFYQTFLNEVYRILKQDGIAVILTACKEEMSRLKTDMILLNTYDILVSGKKASVYVFKK